ncbi:DNA-3-methyladenine glycosylase I [Akkermansiaceae bacterium]|nr:DNA-3-methyladenine glycosylase I [Akkermansiaceae bacterium]
MFLITGFAVLGFSSLHSRVKVPENGFLIGADGKARCWWCGDDEEYIRYHDQEWGRGTTDDFRLFEKICLEGFQAGLSWLTILRKRDNFRAAFADFDFHKVAKFGDSDVERLVLDSGIVRHRGKILSTINNAKRALDLLTEFDDLYSYFCQFRPKSQPIRVNAAIPSRTPESTALSKDLKKRGWSFVGPTTAYAFMQAMGLANDHVQGCHRS